MSTPQHPRSASVYSDDRPPLDQIGETEYGPHARTRRPADDGRADRGGPVRPSGPAIGSADARSPGCSVGDEPATAKLRQLDVLRTPHPDVPSVRPAALHRWVWRDHRLCDRAALAGQHDRQFRGAWYRYSQRQHLGLRATEPRTLERLREPEGVPVPPGPLGARHGALLRPGGTNVSVLDQPPGPGFSKKDAIAECSADLVVMSIAPAAPETDIVGAAVRDPALGRSGPPPLRHLRRRVAVGSALVPTSGRRVNRVWAGRGGSVLVTRSFDPAARAARRRIQGAVIADNRRPMNGPARIRREDTCGRARAADADGLALRIQRTSGGRSRPRGLATGPWDELSEAIRVEPRRGGRSRATSSRSPTGASWEIGLWPFQAPRRRRRRYPDQGLRTAPQRSEG